MASGRERMLFEVYPHLSQKGPSEQRRAFGAGRDWRIESIVKGEESIGLLS